MYLKNYYLSEEGSPLLYTIYLPYIPTFFTFMSKFLLKTQHDETTTTA
jgi:hypothetical protein